MKWIPDFGIAYEVSSKLISGAKLMWTKEEGPALVFKEGSVYHRISVAEFEWKRKPSVLLIERILSAFLSVYGQKRRRQSPLLLASQFQLVLAL